MLSMSVTYDHKMSGLTVEVTEEKLRRMAEDVCRTEDQADLLEHRINHITYHLPFPNEPCERKALWPLAFGFFYTAIMLVLMICGLVQIGTWVIDSIY